MIDGGILLWTGLGFLALGLLVIATWLLHGAVSAAAERRLARRRPRVLAALTEALQGGDRAPAVAELGRLPSDQRIGHLVEMAFAVAGEQRRVVDELAVATGVMSQAERWARSRRWGRRLRAARLLACFGSGEDATGDVLLRDRHPDVRAQAAEWAGEHPTPARVEGLIEMLADPSPRCRFFAGEALTRAGRQALPPLRARLDNGGTAGAGAPGTLEVATALAVPEFVFAAARAIRSPDAAVRAQGAALAAAVGAPEAPDELARLLSDPEPSVREAAARGLGRIGHWPTAAAVATLLGDPDWGVRKAAAEALGGMGPVGELFLRRGTRGTGPTADTAKHALKLEPQSA
jgi:HEAT repeats